MKKKTKKKSVVRHKWLERGLLHSLMPYYTLCTTQEMFESELKKRHVDPFPGVTKGKGATTNFLTKHDHVIALVCFFDPHRDQVVNYGLITHEAIHIWQELRKIMGEENPSHEFEAYVVQQISQNLMWEFERQRKARRSNRNSKKKRKKRVNTKNLRI